MNAAHEIDVLISEVGPRDGLQSIQSIMPLEAKKRWITAEAAAGVKEIEVGSFVPKKILPQLADTAELVQHALAINGLTVAVLVPNLRGAQGAIAAGAHKITVPVSASETHSLRNVNRTHAQMLDEIRAIAALIRTLPEAAAPQARRRFVDGVRLHAGRADSGRGYCESRRSHDGGRLRRSRPLRHHRLREPRAGAPDHRRSVGRR